MVKSISSEDDVAIDAFFDDWVYEAGKPEQRPAARPRRFTNASPAVCRLFTFSLPCASNL